MLNIGHGVINPGTYDTNQLLGYVDRLRTGTLIVSAVPLLRAAFHLRRIVGHQGQPLEATMSGHGTGGNEIIQQQRVKGSESATRTLDGLVDSFRRGVDPVGIVTGSPGILDIVPRLETLEALGAGVVDILSVGDERSRRRRSDWGRHFEWRMG